MHFSLLFRIHVDAEVMQIEMKIPIKSTEDVIQSYRDIFAKYKIKLAIVGKIWTDFTVCLTCYNGKAYLNEPSILTKSNLFMTAGHTGTIT